MSPGDDIYIQETSKEFNILKTKINDLFKDIKCNNYEEYIEKLNILKSEIEKLVVQNEEYNKYIPNNIDKVWALKILITNLYHDKFKEAQNKLLKK